MAHNGKLACHAGPFAIVAGTPAPSAAGPGEAGNAAGAAESSTLVTHFTPHKARADLEHTIKFFPLALGLFEGQLGSSFPLPSYHQASHPCSWRCSNARATCCANSAIADKAQKELKYQVTDLRPCRSSCHQIAWAASPS